MHPTEDEKNKKNSQTDPKYHKLYRELGFLYDYEYYEKKAEQNRLDFELKNRQEKQGKKNSGENEDCSSESEDIDCNYEGTPEYRPPAVQLSAADYEELDDFLTTQTPIQTLDQNALIIQEKALNKAEICRRSSIGVGNGQESNMTLEEIQELDSFIEDYSQSIKVPFSLTQSKN